jgi:hypothetical protein
VLRTITALAILLLSFVSVPADSQEVPPDPDPMVAAVLAATTTAPPAPVEVAPPATTTAVEAPPPEDVFVRTYEWLRALPPEELIRIAWDGTGQIDRALRIARRESGLRCDADNPRSSASGLFQTLAIHRPRAERLGLAWSDVTGPDCLADVILAKAIYADSGWGPWRM